MWIHIQNTVKMARDEEKSFQQLYHELADDLDRVLDDDLPDHFERNNKEMADRITYLFRLASTAALTEINKSSNPEKSALEDKLETLTNGVKAALAHIEDCIKKKAQFEPNPMGTKPKRPSKLNISEAHLETPENPVPIPQVSDVPPIATASTGGRSSPPLGAVGGRMGSNSGSG